MKNFVQPGANLDLIAPAGGVTSGAGVLIGSIFAVATVSAAAGAEFVGATEGVFDLLAEGAGSGQALAVGDAVFWDNAAKRTTKTASGNTKIGVAVAAKASDATVARVRLNANF